MQFHNVNVGDELPTLEIPITVELITSGAIATRDYFPGHHDAEAARELGSPHIFMNILTTSALSQRFIEDWVGPTARFKDLQIKLGAPNYPSDTMIFSGQVSNVDNETQIVDITFKGKNSMGNHVTGMASVVLP